MNYLKNSVTSKKKIGRKDKKTSLNQSRLKRFIVESSTNTQSKWIPSGISKSKSNVIISIFAGRMADAGHDPVPQIVKSIKLCKKFKNVKILWASTREPYNFIQTKQINCDIITVPPSIIEKIENFGKKIDDLTTDTVQGFKIDSEKSKFILLR